MPLATILALIQAAAVLLPELEATIPPLERAVEGQPVTAADIASLDAVIVTLNAQAAARAASIQGAAA